MHPQLLEGKGRYSNLYTPQKPRSRIIFLWIFRTNLLITLDPPLGTEFRALT